MSKHVLVALTKTTSVQLLRMKAALRISWFKFPEYVHCDQTLDKSYRVENRVRNQMKSDTTPT